MTYVLRSSRSPAVSLWWSAACHQQARPARSMPRYHIGLDAKLITRPGAETGMVAVLMSASYAPSLVARAASSSRQEYGRYGGKVIREREDLCKICVKFCEGPGMCRPPGPQQAEDFPLQDRKTHAVDCDPVARLLDWPMNLHHSRGHSHLLSVAASMVITTPPGGRCNFRPFSPAVSYPDDPFRR